LVTGAFAGPRIPPCGQHHQHRRDRAVVWRAHRGPRISLRRISWRATRCCRRSPEDQS